MAEESEIIEKGGRNKKSNKILRGERERNKTERSGMG